MHRIIIVILILVLLIYYLYNKKKESYYTIPSQYQPSINNMYSLILNNQKIPINSVQVTNTLQQNISGSILNVGTNISTSKLNVTNLKVNNLTTSNISLEEIDQLKPIIVNNICNENNVCLTQKNIDMLNLLESPILNRMYLSDASNCKIFNNLNSIKFENQDNIFRILGVTIGNNIVNDTASKPFFVNNKVGYYYTSQANTDGSNNIGFTIQVPTPSQLGFTPAVLWVEVYDCWALIIQITDEAGFINFYAYDQNNYNIYAPDGNITQHLFNLNNQPIWIPMPFNYNTLSSSNSSSKRLILSRVFANRDNFKISGIAFTTNPWNHLILSSLAIMYNSNKLLTDSRYLSPEMATAADIWNNDYILWRNTTGPTNPSNIIVRIPIVNSGSDKILFLVTNNDTFNENMKAVYIFEQPNIQPTISNTKDLTTAKSNDVLNNPMIRLNNFTTSFNNPFSRHYNSSAFNKYIGTVIPSNLINTNYIIVGLQLPVALDTTLLVGTRIEHIGTHDKIPII